MQPLLTSSNPPVGSEPMTLHNVAWLGSINYLGTLIGTFIWGTAADRLGRKTTACLVAIPNILSWVLILLAQNFWWLVIARVFSGISNSGTIIVAPVFISEMAQDHLRGFFGCFLVIFLNVGVVYSYIVGSYWKYHVLSICCLVIPVIFLLTFIWLPETPMFLWKKGQVQRAEQSLLWYRGGSSEETHSTLSKYKLTQNIKNKTNLKSLVATPGTTKAFIIAVSLMFAMQLSGTYTILSFAVNIFEMCGTSLTPYQSAITIGSVQVIFSCLCSLLIDRLGRKLLLVGTLIVIALSQAFLGIYLFMVGYEQNNSTLNWVPIVCLSLHITAFSTGLGPVPSVLKSEIFPPDIRGYALSKVALANGVIAFSVIKLFPLLKECLNLHGCFWLYSGCCIVFAIFFAIYLPETKGKPQNEILKIFNKEDLAEPSGEMLQEMHRIIA